MLSLEPHRVGDSIMSVYNNVVTFQIPDEPPFFTTWLKACNKKGDHTKVCQSKVIYLTELHISEVCKYEGHQWCQKCVDE